MSVVGDQEGNSLCWILENWGFITVESFAYLSMDLSQ